MVTNDSAATESLRAEILPNGFTLQQPTAASSSGTTSPSPEEVNPTVAPLSDKGAHDPIAVVGVACRLPGHNTDPHKLWEFIISGGIAEAHTAPASRFRIAGHYDGSLKPGTMRSPGGMFLEDVDLHAMDAQFFNLSSTEAVAMEPQQRQLLEVVYECLENGGITLESISGKPVGCFVGSYAVDFQDMQARDPEDRPESSTIGIGRAILSNRISHFLNIKGPSMTIDTACSGSLVSIDVGCQYLQARQADAVLVAGANLYLSPDHNQDMGAMRGASSATGRCHTFDAKADGYIKAEAVNAVYLKRLSDALRDGDPIRAVIRGTATNSDGWTPGIASPSSEAQATAIRAAYANAGISNFNDTAYLECHGTGTLAGDPVEVKGVASVFAPSRPTQQPLLIGSIKSNIGHSEPAAGISGLLKAVLAVEKGRIPGNPTFVDPNPNIDFETLRVRASRWSAEWPATHAKYRRASVNSFGFGGSNAHVVVDAAEHFLAQKALPMPAFASSFQEASEEDFFGEETVEESQGPVRPRVLVFSANDQDSIKGYLKKLAVHLLNPQVSVKLSDLAYTLSERRSRHFHRAFTLLQGAASEKVTSVPADEAIFGKPATEKPQIGFVFTGQGAQWPQMGRDLLTMFPQTAGRVVDLLDDALQRLPIEVRPAWKLRDELCQSRSPDHLRQPEFSQPIVTALQLAYLAVLASWDIRPVAVVGHSSGEIAAACAAGLLTQDEAIKVAYFRGLAAKHAPVAESVGMLAIGIGADAAQPYLDQVNVAGTKPLVQIACYNSPSSLTLSGSIDALEAVRDAIQADGHFARMLQVSLAYHSRYMAEIGEGYERLLQDHCSPKHLQAGEKVAMFSSVTGSRVLRNSSTDFAYWKRNMVSPVRFAQACHELLTDKKHGADFLIELGPSNALAGPVKQVQKGLPGGGASVIYTAVAKRGPDTILSLFDVPGRLFLAGGSVSLQAVNTDESVEKVATPAVLVDLPNYAWNHSTKYWHENEASKDWRFRKFVHHDLLGTKVLNAAWTAPVWKKMLRLEDVPWLKDHRMGPDIIFPGAGYVAMAIEAAYQATFATASEDEVAKLTTEGFHYRLRDLKFPRALVLEENVAVKVHTTLYPVPGSNKGWHEYKVSSLAGDAWVEHSHGFIRLDKGVYTGRHTPSAQDLALPLQYPAPGSLWYKAMHDAGYNFGEAFQKHVSIEATPGQRYSRSLVSLEAPPSKWARQSDYPLHPACMDGAFQSVSPSLWKGDRSSINAVLVPAGVDSLVVAAPQNQSQVRSLHGLSVTTSEYLGIGRPDDMRNYASHGTVYDPDDKSLIMELTGLRYHRLETRSDVFTAHTYTRVAWKPDLSTLDTEEALALALHTASERDASAVQELLNLAAHKKPNLSVAEVKIGTDDHSSLWLARKSTEQPLRAAYKSFHFITASAAGLLKAQEENTGTASSTFSLLDLSKTGISLPEDKFDLVVVQIGSLDVASLNLVLENIQKLLATQGSVLFVEAAPGLTNGHAGSPLFEALSTSGFSKITKLPGPEVAYLAEQTEENTKHSQDLVVVHLTDSVPSSVSQVVTSLSQLGWSLKQHTISTISSVPPKSTVLILDELHAPVMATATATQWDALKSLIQTECHLVWVTQGAQMAVSDPLKAVAHGFWRTVRAEEPLLSLLTLDVESVSHVEPTLRAIDAVLRRAGVTPSGQGNEFEYVERGGLLHVARILPDTKLNAAKLEDLQGTPAREVDLHASPATVRMVTEHLGNIDSLHFVEVGDGTALPLGPGRVEVELFASALNFKDVAVSMGIVPENEHLLGLEGAGVVVRVGEGVTNRHVGQRVVVFEKGTFANRIIATTERTYPLPDSMTYEEAATLPAVYLTSIYALFYLSGLKKGDKVLIHSASGGVGIASIQLAQYKGCEIFVTVGTPEKRAFLKETFGIAEDHIFSSRTPDFAREIMTVTKGYGIDVILNSLTGELLNESWRIVADGGTMVEIGKKDILDRNSLPMEPFVRNASFRALDFSYRQISDALIAEILEMLFGLIADGHVKPIAPREIFPYHDIPAAFRALRAGKHIGKLVISNGDNTEVQVQARRAKRVLQISPAVSYLIVGGLKGLCGSLAIHLAKLGARHLAVIGRSGYQDDRSQSIIKDIRALGCEIDLLQGDVSKLEDVRRCFSEISAPVGGIVQGAMVLRDRTFASMSNAEYHGALACKVQGTWNLHQVSLEHASPLTFFTMLSSISGVVGQKGQANYAGGNVFQDALAAFRRDTLGLPAVSINLGVIEDVGYIHARDGMQQQLDTSVWTGINEALARRILEYAIHQQTGSVDLAGSVPQLVTGIPVPQAADSPLLRDVRFAPLCVTADGLGAGAAQGAGDKDQELRTLLLLLRTPGSDAAAVLAATLAVVGAQFVKVLRLGEPMDVGRPMSIYGLDSLAAVEFRNWARVALGAELTTLDIVNATSLTALSEKMVAKMVAA